MVRYATAVLALTFVIAALSAKEYKGTVTKIDTEKKVITVKVGDNEKRFTYSDTTEFMRSSKKGGNKAISKESLAKLAARINAKGSAATVVSEEGKDSKETVGKDGNPIAAKVTFTRGGKKAKSTN